MNIAYYTTRLAASGDAIDCFVRHTGIEQARWKPSPDKWSMLEVVCHLYDEERFDFRQRIDYLLHKPGEDLPRFEPLAWVSEHRYAEQDIVEMRTLFRRERDHSVAWLASLDSANWDAYKDHPVFGRLSASRFLASWVAHDYLHLRQMARLNYEHLAAMSGEELNYAGNW